MWTHGEAYVKPSSAWRTGFFMYEGWPAQEDGTDSQSHPSRKTHDLLYPGHTAGARRVVRGQHPGGIEDRYPSWWGHAPAALPLDGAPPPEVLDRYQVGVGGGDDGGGKTTPSLAALGTTPLMLAVFVGAAQNIISKAAKYA